MKKDKNKTLLNLKKFNNAFKKELKAKIYSGGGGPTPLSLMNTLIFEDRTSGAPKIHLEGEIPKKTEAIVEEKTIEQIKEPNIASQIEKIDGLWNNGKKPKKEPSYYQTGKEYLNPFNYFGTGKKEPEKKPKQWKKETFIQHLKKNGVNTNNSEIKNYIAEKFSISDRDFLEKINQAKERKKEEDQERREYIAENSKEVNEKIDELFKKTQEIEEEKQKAKITLKSTPDIRKKHIKQIIESLEQDKDTLKNNSSELIKEKEKLQKMQAEVANPSFLPNLNELFQAEGKTPFTEESFNRFNRIIKGEQGNNTNMDSFYEELKQSKKERKEEEIPESSPDSEPSMSASKKSVSFNTKNAASEEYVKGQGGAVSGPSFLSDEGDDGGGAVSDDGKKVAASSSVQRSSSRKITPTKILDPSPKPSQSSKARVSPGSKPRLKGKKKKTPNEEDDDDDDDNDWEDVDEEQEQEEKSSERKEPKFIEPEVEEAFEFSDTINSENKTIIRNIIKNLNGILSNPILSLSTGSKSDIKHVNNVIIYDEIREGEERLKKMSEDSIYIPKYIPQLPSEQ